MRKKWRCDHCGKWVENCNLVTLPEEYFSLLESDNEFCLCVKCIDNKKYTKEYWVKWISKKRQEIKNREDRYI